MQTYILVFVNINPFLCINNKFSLAFPILVLIYRKNRVQKINIYNPQLNNWGIIWRSIFDRVERLCYCDEVEHQKCKPERYLSLFQLQMLTLVTVDINAGINVTWEDFPHWMEGFGATLWIHGIIVLLSIMVSFCTYIFKELSNWTTNMHQPC